MSWTLKINGTPQTFEPSEQPATLADLLKQLQMEKAAVVAEVDGQIIPRERFAQTVLRDGQSIELVRFVGGG
ncbi:MAG TPA: sulfur carrier protein ThiS [Anaerohalosphaeraceae bacterium]|mgnify:FL=1|nr:sulfur carrier protein ThiS [Anaerohalosphaeraceae bacterium]